jgi:hypothetical protein
MSQRLFHLMRSVDSAFAGGAQLPTDRNSHWRQLKRHIVCMQDALSLVHTTLHMERELGIALSEDTARKIEGYARWALAKMDPKRLPKKCCRR